MDKKEKDEKDANFRYQLCINNILFTQREIEVISCILHGRGEKKIATLLAISPRTVGTHVRNLMLKIGCCSKEKIIDFVESSSKFSLIKNYYIDILVMSLFKKYSAKIEKLVTQKHIICHLSRSPEESKNKLLKQIIEDLDSINIKLIYDTKKSNNTPKGVALISVERGDAGSEVKAEEIEVIFDQIVISDKEDYCVNFGEKDNYYNKLFSLIKKILNDKSVDDLAEQFNSECLTIKNHGYDSKADINDFKKGIDNRIIKNNFVLYASLIFCVVSLLGFTTYKILMDKNVLNSNKIISNMALPNDNILLPRKEILEHIDKKFSEKEGINAIALVGIGGAGKTTIARQYARNKKIPIIWEVKADSRENILISFEQLAYLFCNNEEEKKELAIIETMAAEREKEARIISFITKSIKKYSDWLIIYNDVTTFKDIRKYFPYDPEVWGNGKVIITTRDSNIVNNSYILADNVIQVTHLSEDEKYKLFTSIVYGKSDVMTKGQEDLTKNFLAQIPPFPLDVSLAAYYIKEEKIPYNIYLEHIHNYNNDFITAQKAILSDVGEYTKTRHDILGVSVEYVLNSDPNFSDLLLLISMINFSDIPKKLLINYKEDTIVGRFMHELRKFSFIIENVHKVGDINNQTFSMHNGTQDIALEYLQNLMKLDKNSEKIQEIVSIMNKYADSELASPTQKKTIEAFHTEEFLNNYYKLPSKGKPLDLTVKLGQYYFDTSNYKKAKKWLEKASLEYSEFYGKRDLRTAKIATYLGTVYRNMGDYKKAKILFEESYNVYKTISGEDDVETSWSALYLGSVYRNLGEYKNAKQLLEKTLLVYEKHFGVNTKESAWVSIYLGSLYKNIGNYKKAKGLLEHSLEVYRANLDPEDIRIAWASARLAGLYNSIGYYKNAKELAHNSLAIYKKYYGEKFIETAWASSLLGSIYKSLGDYDKAEAYLKQSIAIYKDLAKDDIIANITWARSILGNLYTTIGDYKKAEVILKNVLEVYEKYYGKDNIITAEVQRDLADLYVHINDYENAEIYLNLACKTFSENNHTDIYLCYETYADMYKNKYVREQNQQQKREYKLMAIEYLKKALLITKDNFLDDFIYNDRLKFKLAELSDGQVPN